MIAGVQVGDTEAVTSEQRDDPPLQLENARRWSQAGSLFVGATGLSVGLLVELADGELLVSQSTYAWWVVTSSLAWLAIISGRHASPTAWVIAITISAQFAITSLANSHLAASAVVSMFVLLTLWSSMLLPSWWSIALVATLFGVLAVHATSETIAKLPETPLFLSALLVPIILAALHRRRLRATETLVHALWRDASARAPIQQSTHVSPHTEQHASVDAERLQSLSGMASGLAHELNNVLTPIRGLAELLMEGVTPELSRRYGKRILDSTIAAASLATALVTHARRGRSVHSATNVGELLEHEVIPSVRQRIPSSVLIATNIDRSLHVDVEGTPLHRCLTDLLVTAAHGLAEGTIEVSVVRGAPESSTPSSDVSKCAIVIRDDARPVSREHSRYLADPLARDEREKPDLLERAFEFANAHRGQLSIDSDTACTTYTLTLPCSVSHASQLGTARSTNSAPCVLIFGRDQDLLDELEEHLTTAGCVPSCSAEPIDVLAVLDNGEVWLDLFVLDDRAEEDTAERLYLHARECRPELNVIRMVDCSDRVLTTALGEPLRWIRRPPEPALAARMLTEILGRDMSTRPPRGNAVPRD